MKKRLRLVWIIFLSSSLFLGGCAKKQSTVETSADAQSTIHIVTDMEGRKVTIPKKITKVLSLSNNTTVDMFTLAPDKLVGLSFTLKDEAKKYINEKYYKLPLVGTTSDKKIDYETILKLAPDLIICSNEDQVYSADEIQKQLNIPTVMVATEAEKTDKVYTFLGDCIGEQKRAKQLADYSKKVLDNVKKLVSKIPDSEKVKVYYAEGASWLQTDISGNVHTEVLDLSGGKNVADISETKTGSMATVSFEQVLAWNPDVVLVGATAAKGDFYSKVFSDPKWSAINAVKNKKVYKIPALPFNWVDRPPSAVRVLGVEWLANKLYPQYVKLDINKEVKDYYETFFNYKLTDDEVGSLIQ